MESRRNPSESFDGIQYLRAIAALMVVVFHAGHYFGPVPKWLIFGSRGVDIFFIISGFIMAYSTSRFDPAAGRASQAVDFWAKRFIRVVPLYWIALLYDNRGHIRHGAADIGLLADFAFLPRFHPRHPTEIWPSLVQGWTINYEVFFYLLFGLAFFFGSRRYLALFIGFALLLGTGLAWDFSNAPAAFWTSSVMGEFLLGIGIYFLYASRKQWRPPVWVAVGALLFGFLGMAVPNGSVERLFADGPFAALIVWGGLYIGKEMPRQRVLSMLGDASYSIYLVHGFTFVFSYKVLDTLGMRAMEPLNVVAALTACTLVATLMGVAVHFFLERPMLRAISEAWLRWKTRSPKRVAMN